MNDILNTLLKGTPTQRLATLANIFTILGVSAAAIITPIVGADLSLSFQSYGFLAIIGVATLGGLGLCFGVGLFFVAVFAEMSTEKGLGFRLLCFLAWCLATILAIALVLYAHELVVTTKWT